MGVGEGGVGEGGVSYRGGSQGGGLVRVGVRKGYRHAEHNHTLVLRRVLGDPTQPSLEHVVAVEEGLLRRGLQPDLE